MTRILEGNMNARDLRIAIVASRFNETIATRLVDGALGCLRRHGVPEDAITVAWVPGAYELPGVARRFADSGEVDAVVCLGVVIRGETAHFDHVAAQASGGVGALAARGEVPVTNGILTTEDTAQAEDRAGGKLGNKGAEAAAAAIELANLYTLLPKPLSQGGL